MISVDRAETCPITKDQEIKIELVELIEMDEKRNKVIGLQSKECQRTNTRSIKERNGEESVLR